MNRLEIEDQLRHFGFDSLADSLAENPPFRDRQLFIQDVRRARAENTEEELPTWMYRQVLDLVNMWFDLKIKKNPTQGRNLGYGTSNGVMIRNQLRSIKRASESLLSAVTDADQLPDWVATKVATAMDRLVTANEYILSKLDGKRFNMDVDVDDTCLNASELAVVIRLNGW